MDPDDMQVLHPGWDPRRRPRDRRRRPPGLLLFVVAAALSLLSTCSLLRAVPESPPNRPAFPADAFTTPPVRTRAPSTPPVWDEGSPQVNPPTLPTRAARVAGATDADRTCGIDDLSLVNDGGDAATGNSALSIVATNVSSSPCLVGGWPQIKVGQPEPLSLTLTQVSTGLDGQARPPQRLVLDPGAGASVALWWRGHRNAADQTTPQRLVMRFGGGDWREIPLTAPGAGPAPFDVVDGATIEIHPWEPAMLRGSGPRS